MDLMKGKLFLSLLSYVEMLLSCMVCGGVYFNYMMVCVYCENGLEGMICDAK